MSKYAENTSVPVERSLAELKREINRFGATGFGYAEQGDRVQVIFECKGLRIRFDMQLPARKDFSRTDTGRARTVSSLPAAVAGGAGAGHGGPARPHRFALSGAGTDGSGDGVVMGKHSEFQAPVQFDDEAIHGWFELTYAAYLVVPRSVLQSLPGPLQRQLVDALEAIEAHFAPAHAPVDSHTHYTVSLRDDRNRFVSDPLRDYNRGRRRVSADDLRAMCKEAVDAS